mmetsp:Transcript_36083/g.61525  ORF Transcript_36083/g.61525 Transcript_36083/m.61525 type:complete len:263 (-) Transcript_36083:173-961(-)|eukprot:CAMPEP_0183755266 /NCGR_PEP_ID=MMETSP0739-20130205/4085_1 /TAXON_ID=385413 /ORGANISM="Thalassiosira miniscula, Strain CCMP1093" /LENGTH=262 /DNA_ID=CAMNT_0025992049 /DNA_START=205 /DNA_END=993 /DNA_ORIENTATION=+
MSAATMNNLILPGHGYEAFVDFLYATPSQPKLLDMNRSEIIAANRKTFPGPSRNTAVSQGFLGDNKEWAQNYKALKDFHAKNGNCLVPFGKETGSLRSWTERQKKLYASAKLGQQQVDDLKALDFDFNMKHLSTRSVVPKPATTLMTAKAESKEKRNKPKSPEKEKSAKKQKKDAIVGLSTPPAASAPLVRKSSLVIEDELTWNKNYEALKTYKAENGNCSVPFGKETGSLRSWLERQKKLYASSKLDQDKIEKMVELGVSF